MRFCGVLVPIVFIVHRTNCRRSITLRSICLSGRPLVPNRLNPMPDIKCPMPNNKSPYLKFATSVAEQAGTAAVPEPRHDEASVYGGVRLPSLPSSFDLKAVHPS